MLAEVKNEVDIMRLLKGHPNIVHFIDAAWHRMPNGMYEVFILMEYCPGGGIIDMMNRRLRERLTEAEILQIFVDVCEAVGHMHNLRPPLLHRDLKVENILQASPTSFKLCDFGSATALSRTPSNIQELRALEADLNKHTTIQYRAPEMIDVHMKRPIDEKSDVWALGVLLYKLCYYTTPFEEHGPLAILQVSYRIPPYPTYSLQMNTLIGRMLKDLGTTRPSVFEVLNEVHRMRGTKSQFQYKFNAPTPLPLTPSRHAHAKHPTLSMLDGVITYKSSKPTSPRHQTSASISPSKNQGLQAREKVLEAIAPVRRNRPVQAKEPISTSRPPSPQKQSNKPNLAGGKSRPNPNKIDLTEDEKAWTVWTTENKQLRAANVVNDDAWKIVNEKENLHVNAGSLGFTDNFVEKLRPSIESSSALAPKSIVASTTTPKLSDSSLGNSKEINAPLRSTPHANTGAVSRRIPLPHAEKDAFDDLGLGFPAEKPEPTLGEARKLRTGLAIMSSARANRLDVENRPSASPRPAYLSPQSYMQTQAFLSTSPSNASTPASSRRTSPRSSSRPPPSPTADGIPIESRFPSLEELDATFASDPSVSRVHPPNSARLGKAGDLDMDDRQSTLLVARHANGDDGTRSSLNPKLMMQEKQGSSHTRVFELSNDTGGGNHLGKGKVSPSTTMSTVPPRRVASLSLKPTVSRRHRSSISFKHKPPSDDLITPTQSNSHNAPLSSKEDSKSRPPTPPSNSSMRPQADWLTGDENLPVTPIAPQFKARHADVPVLRQSPSKRASFIEKSDVPILEGIAAQPELATVMKPADVSPHKATTPAKTSPTIARFNHHFPPVETPERTTQSVASGLPPGDETSDFSSSSADEGPEDVDGLPVVKTRSGKRTHRKARPSSIHDLVDLWGGSMQHSKEKERGMEHGDQIPQPKRSVLATGSSASKLLSTLARADSPELRVASEISRTAGIGATQKASVAAMASPSNVNARSRPQSLQIFPLRSSDDSYQQSASLEPPVDIKRRHSVRRTSITDMVERYEAIGGNTRPSSFGPGPPSPLAIKKSSSSKSIIQPSDFARSSRPPEMGAPSLIPQTPSTTIAKDILRHRTSPTRALRANAVIPSPSTDRRTFADNYKPSEPPDEQVKIMENIGPRPRRLSLKPPETSKPPITLQERLAVDGRKEKLPQAENRSSPPERPYQGVGKLIDQWQRKAEASEPGRSPMGVKRSSIITKRPGVTAAGKGQ
ncbi:hypothetical protein AX17_000081 [Amanita inopinata Kibby_2008]|nr:hypothetical protein AX17_000081 [Amanita inopinata Kibby_2008]